MMMILRTLVIAAMLLCSPGTVVGFSSRPAASSRNDRLVIQQRQQQPLFSASTESKEQQAEPAVEQVLELSANDEISDAVAPAEEENKGPSGPLFISQGEMDPNALNPDLSDAKQTRVLIYTVLSILPVLFLIPLMLSRELIPLEALPPVDM